MPHGLRTIRGGYASGWWAGAALKAVRIRTRPPGLAIRHWTPEPVAEDERDNWGASSMTALIELDRALARVGTTGLILMRYSRSTPSQNLRQALKALVSMLAEEICEPDTPASKEARRQLRMEATAPLSEIERALRHPRLATPASSLAGPDHFPIALGYHGSPARRGRRPIPRRPEQHQPPRDIFLSRSETWRVREPDALDGNSGATGVDLASSASDRSIACRDCRSMRGSCRVNSVRQRHNSRRTHAVSRRWFMPESP